MALTSGLWVIICEVLGIFSLFKLCIALLGSSVVCVGFCLFIYVVSGNEKGGIDLVWY